MGDFPPTTKAFLALPSYVLAAVHNAEWLAVWIARITLICVVWLSMLQISIAKTQAESLSRRASLIVCAIRGSAARSSPRPSRIGCYMFAPLEVILSGAGPARRTTWQPMKNDFDGENDDRVAVRVEPYYFVDGLRLRIVLDELNRGVRETGKDEMLGQLSARFL